MTLPEFWFVLIAFMFVSYFVLEGFDFGVGALLPVLGGDDIGRRVMINTIAPVWDANETWLVLAAGAMFAAFPHWYGSAFSAFYLPLLGILACLIARGVAFEFRGKVDDPRWRGRWDVCIVTGSIVTPFLWGVFFANLVHGLPLNASGDYAGTLGGLFSPFAVLGGLVVLAMFLTHGAIFLALRTRGGIRHDARALAGKLALVAVVLAALFLGWTTRGTASARRLAIVVAALIGALVATGAARRARVRSHDRARSSAGLHVLRRALPECDAVDAGPGVQPHHRQRQFDAVHADGDELGRVLVVPFVLAYQAWSYWVFRSRLTRDHIPLIRNTAPPRAATTT